MCLGRSRKPGDIHLAGVSRGVVGSSIGGGVGGGVVGGGGGTTTLPSCAKRGVLKIVTYDDGTGGASSCCCCAGLLVSWNVELQTHVVRCNTGHANVGHVGGGALCTTLHGAGWEWCAERVAGE